MTLTSQQVDACPNLAKALVEALAELSIIEATKEASIPTKTGGGYKYKYADIGDVIKVSRPVLAAKGIIALTPLHSHGDSPAVSVVFLHTSGERLDFGPFPFPQGKDAQATGSMVTYHRRYALVAALGMAAGDDDDGAHAAASERRQEEAPATSGFLGTFNDLAPDVKNKVLAWLRERSLRPTNVPAEQIPEVEAFIASLTSETPAEQQDKVPDPSPPASSDGGGAGGGSLAEIANKPALGSVRKVRS